MFNTPHVLKKQHRKCLKNASMQESSHAWITILIRWFIIVIRVLDMLDYDDGSGCCDSPAKGAAGAVCLYTDKTETYQNMLDAIDVILKMDTGWKTCAINKLLKWLRQVLEQ